MLRSRLRMELQEKQALEMKVSELTDKLVEAKKGLQETSLALHKVQMATNQLMAKRDQRELQLQAAIDQNHLYEKKISELENHISRMNEISEAKSGAHTHSEKLINEQLEKIHQLEEEGGLLKGQISSLRRENMRLTDEKTDLEYALETKKKRIAFLEETLKSDGPDLINTRDSFLQAVSSRLNTASRSPRGINNSESAIPELSTPSIDIEGLNKRINDISNMESKLEFLVSDKKTLEDRLKQLEENMMSQNSAHQKQLQQQQLFYQQQLQQQQQHIQHLQYQAYAAQAGGGLPMETVQMGPNGVPVVVRAVSRGSMMVPVGAGERPRSQQRAPGDDRPRSSQRSNNPAPPGSSEQNRDRERETQQQQEREREQRERDRLKQEKEREQRDREKERIQQEKERERQERDDERRREKERERERVQQEKDRQEREKQDRDRQEKERERDEERKRDKEREREREKEKERQKASAPRETPPSDARPRSTGGNRVVTPNNAQTVSLPMGLAAASRKDNGISNLPVETVTFSKPGPDEKPVPANSAAAENAQGGSNSRQPSRQEQIMSRVTSATGQNPEEVKKKLADERKEMKKAILVWNKSFIEENKREPTKAEREKNVGNHYRRYRQVNPKIYLFFIV